MTIIAFKSIRSLLHPRTPIMHPIQLDHKFYYQEFRCHLPLFVLASLPWTRNTHIPTHNTHIHTIPTYTQYPHTHNIHWRRQICWERHDGQEQGRMRLQTTTENCYLLDHVYSKGSNLNGSGHGSTTYPQYPNIHIPTMPPGTFPG